jgi:DNA helicase-2/ATP-dependent DNA helicase PcrA
VAAASRLIAHNTGRLPKPAQRAHRGPGEIHVFRSLDPTTEARFIARTIRRVQGWRADRGMRYADVAILLRRHSQSFPLEIALALENIPYHAVREQSVLLSPVLERFLTLLRLHLQLRGDPAYSDRAATALLYETYFPAPGPQPEDVDRFQRLVEATGGYRPAAAAAAAAGTCLPFRGVATAGRFSSAVNGLFEEGSPGRVVQRLIAAFPALGAVETDGDAESVNGLAALAQIADLALEAEDAERFHAALSLAAARAPGGRYRKVEGEGVSLLTIHAAKGRDWRAVVLPGWVEGLLPATDASVEEERRLAYVALARPTSTLIVTYPERQGRCPLTPSWLPPEAELPEAQWGWIAPW